MKQNMKVKLSLIISIIGLLCLVGGTSYALLQDNKAGTKQIINVGKVKLTLTESANGITLTDLTDMTDEEGFSQSTSYSFTVKNDGDAPTKYDLKLIKDTTKTNTLDEKFLKIGLYYNGTKLDAVNLAEVSNIINSGVVIEEGVTDSYVLRIWIDPDSITDSTIESGATISLKLQVDAEQLFGYDLYSTIANQVKTTSVSYSSINGTSDNGVFKFSGTDDNGGSNPIYYYRGNVTNNNVLFADLCWKIVRTTSTGGVKLIYNGEPFYEYENLDKIAQSSYVVSTNTPTATPFTFDSTNLEWSSGTAGVASSTNTIEFTVSQAGDYVLNYSVSSESCCDKGAIYKNGTAILSSVGGVVSGTLNLSGLTTSDVIKVTYTKDSSVNNNDDKVTFSVAKPSGDKTLSCNNTGTDSQYGTSVFNSNNSSPADVGYMYGTRYTYSSKTMTSITDSYVYGKTVTYSNGTYTLNTTTTSTGSSWSTDRTTLANGYHYTCFSTSSTCSTVYYITYFGYSSTAYYLTFTGGVNLATAKSQMYTNTTNSTIKTKVDSFYTSKLSSYTSSLENTIFCNDRSFASGTTGGPLSGETVNSTSYSYYAPYYRIWSSYSPSLQCTNTNDRFSLSTSSGGTSGYGNNKLTYPIGLLTSDEVMLAGGKGGTTNSNYYLYTGKTFWLGSPDAWVTINSFVASVLSTGVLYYYSPANAWGVRPSVSLQPETIYSEGDGTVSSPYKITSQ